MTAARKLMDADEFLEWAFDREGVWELVDGVPVPKYGAELMAGARQEHDIITVNLLSLLNTALRGRCRVFSEAIGTRVHNKRLRRPDVTVDCGPKRQGSGETTTPTIMFEVLSPTTRSEDLLRKPFEYRGLPTLQQFALLEPLAAVGTLWSRDPEGRWSDQPLSGLDSSIDLSSVGIQLSMTDVYFGVDLAEPG